MSFLLRKGEQISKTLSGQSQLTKLFYINRGYYEVEVSACLIAVNKLVSSG